MINFKFLWKLRTVTCISPFLLRRSSTSKYKSISCFHLRHMSESSIDEANIGIPNPKDPLGRTYRILKDDVVNLSKGRINIPDEEYFPYFCDFAIIGGGIMGSSIAYWLQQRVNKALKIVVIERDPTVSFVHAFEISKYISHTITILHYCFYFSMKKHLLYCLSEESDSSFLFLKTFKCPYLVQNS